MNSLVLVTCIRLRCGGAGGGRWRWQPAGQQGMAAGAGGLALTLPAVRRVRGGRAARLTGMRYAPAGTTPATNARRLSGRMLCWGLP